MVKKRITELTEATSLDDGNSYFAVGNGTNTNKISFGSVSDAVQDNIQSSGAFMTPGDLIDLTNACSTSVTKTERTTKCDLFLAATNLKNAVAYINGVKVSDYIIPFCPTQNDYERIFLPKGTTFQGDSTSGTLFVAPLTISNYENESDVCTASLTGTNDYIKPLDKGKLIGNMFNSGGLIIKLVKTGGSSSATITLYVQNTTSSTICIKILSKPRLQYIYQTNASAEAKTYNKDVLTIGRRYTISPGKQIQLFTHNSSYDSFVRNLQLGSFSFEKYFKPDISNFIE